MANDCSHPAELGEVPDSPDTLNKEQLNAKQNHHSYGDSGIGLGSAGSRLCDTLSPHHNNDCDQTVQAQFDFDNLGELLDHLNFHDLFNDCRHGLRWVHCWHCGFFDDYNVDTSRGHKSV